MERVTRKKMGDDGMNAMKNRGKESLGNYFAPFLSAESRRDSTICFNVNSCSDITLFLLDFHSESSL